MPEVLDLTAALAALRAVEPGFLTCSDDDLLADTALVEQLGRVIDGWRAGAAAQIEHRSRKTLGEESLAFRTGARDGVELVQQLTRVTASEAKRRVGIGAALAPKVGLTGEVLPGRFPDLAASVAAGDVSLEAARVIVNLWKSVRFRAEPELLEIAMGSLLATAQTTDEEGLRDVAGHWDLALNPDGSDERERKQRRKRALRVGRTLDDGTTSVSLVMTPEDLAVLKELLQSRRRGKPMVRTEAGSDDTDDTLGPEWREDPAECEHPEEPRSRAQQDYDTLTGALALAARAEAEGIGGVAVTHETVITVTATEVEARAGQGWAPGIMAGLPMPVIERKACTGELRLLVTGPTGEPLWLSRAHRLFSPAQKVALVIAAGGRCQFPGCRVPHPYLEAHHVEWYARDGGATTVENGIMLCSYHHHLVHAKDSPIEIRIADGDQWIVPRGWTGPPEFAHRRQTGHHVQPRPRRVPNPWAARGAPRVRPDRP